MIVYVGDGYFWSKNAAGKGGNWLDYQYEKYRGGQNADASNRFQVGSLNPRGRLGRRIQLEVSVHPSTQVAKRLRSLETTRLRPPREVEALDGLRSG